MTGLELPFAMDEDKDSKRDDDCDIDDARFSMGIVFVVGESW